MRPQFILKALHSEKIQLPLQEATTLGTDEHCTYKVFSPGVSARHLRIEIKNNYVTIKDLQSHSGTFVNETKIQEAHLQIHDIIRLGDYEFSFQQVTVEKKNPLLESKNNKWHSDLIKIPQIAQSEFSVLLLGSSGTGKDVLARAIHHCSTRASGPMVSVNCSALTETLIESELFGHVKGSFTGAINDRKGAFEAARGGTLFLDEIGDLPLSMQAKLLRALENNEIRPVGSDRTLKTDVRIIAATHQNLIQKSQLGEFRQDLFYRLNVISIETPNLNQRIEDFEDLIYSFAKSMRVRFSHGAIEILKKYEWPGNIRELKNLVAKASALHAGELITEEHVEKLLGNKVILHTSPSAPLKVVHSSPAISKLPVLKEIEKELIISGLIKYHGNQKRTAQELAIPKSTLHDRLKYYEIDVKKFKV